MSFTYKAKFYNGYKNNIDSQRPTIDITCKKVSKGKVDLNNSYILINILVNGGKHDTYILKNTVSGKIIKSTCIRVIQQ